MSKEQSGRVLCGLVLSILAIFLTAPMLCAQERWTEEQANAWYAQQPWPVGADFLPSHAINELEMWQEATFNPAQIDQELGCSV